MKKLSLYVFLALMWCNASVAEELYCKVEKAFRCDAKAAKNLNHKYLLICIQIEKYIKEETLKA